MTHYLLLKLKESQNLSAFMQEARPRLERFLASDVGITGVKLVPNAADRAENMDLLIMLEMREAAVLPRYLASDIHHDFILWAGPQVAQKITFDLE